MNLKQFIGESQLSAMRSACRGEEGEYFRTMVADLKQKIIDMPKTYETDGQGDEAVVVLHYFKGSSDWWIIERDQEEDQLQAFGFACLNGDYLNAEMGYISIEELILYGVELDLYYRPEKIGDIRSRHEPDAMCQNKKSPSQAATREEEIINPQTPVKESIS